MFLSIQCTEFVCIQLMLTVSIATCFCWQTNEHYVQFVLVHAQRAYADSVQRTALHMIHIVSITLTKRIRRFLYIEKLGMRKKKSKVCIRMGINFHVIAFIFRLWAASCLYFSVTFVCICVVFVIISFQDLHVISHTDIKSSWFWFDLRWAEIFVRKAKTVRSEIDSQNWW